MIRRRLLNLILTAFLMMFPAGCYDRIELEGIAFVVGLGVDKGPGNTLDVTARIAIPAASSGDGGGGGAASGAGKLGGSKPITVRAHTIPEAITLLNTTVERRVSLLQLTSIYFGEELAREGVGKYIRPLTRMREVRRTTNILFVKGPAREMFMSNRPVLEQSVSRWHEDLQLVARHTGLAPVQKLHEFMTAIESSTEDPIAAVIAVNPEIKRETGEESSIETSSGPGRQEAKDGADMSFQPGRVIRKGGNPVEILGTAIFCQDRLVAVLDGIDTRMLLALRGELQRTQMDFENPFEKGEYLGVELKHARSPEIRVNAKSPRMQVFIREKLEGDLVATQGTTDLTDPDNMNRLERHIRQRLEERQRLLIARMYHEYQAEPFHILQRARKQFATDRELEAFGLREKLKDAQIEVKIDFQIRRVGTQLAPSAIK